jgi:hypothetical protein
MQASQVPEPLRERLGAEATSGLLDLFETAKLECGEDVMRLSTDRFERRLTEECSKIRVEMAHLHSGLRQDMQEMGAGLRKEMYEMRASLQQEDKSVRQEMREMGAALRQEMRDLGAALRQETQAMGAGLRQDIASQRFEILKWAFLFWVGQFFAVASLIAVLIRYLRPTG